MADKRISELTELVRPNGAVDIVPVMDTSTNKTKKALLSKLPISDSAVNHSFPFTTDITSNTATTQNLTSLSSSSGFNGSTNLTSIYVGTAVTSIGSNTFTDCTSLIDVTLAPGVTSIGDQAFAFCTSMTSINIPESVISIGALAFQRCDSLASIVIPNSVTTITFSAFATSKVVNLTIGAGVTSIGNQAFQNCTSLFTINSLATSAPTLGTNVFGNIPATQINVPAGATASYKSAGDGTTYGGLTIVEV